MTSPEATLRLYKAFHHQSWEVFNIITIKLLIQVTAENEESATTTTMSNLLPLAQQPYVSELLSFTLDRLHKEPELLRVDAEKIRRQMQEVAVRNNRAFIAAADALLEIREEGSMQLRVLEV